MVLLIVSACATSGGQPMPARPHSRVTDDAVREYPGLTVAVEDVGDAYHQARIVLSTAGSRWRLLIERYASIRRLAGCLVVVDHWGSDVADCWVFVPATGRLWYLQSVSGRFDHVYLHPQDASDGQLRLSLDAHGDHQSYEGPIANFDLATGKVESTHPDAAMVTATTCPAGDPSHR